MDEAEKLRKEREEAERRRAQRFWLLMWKTRAAFQKRKHK